MADKNVKIVAEIEVKSGDGAQKVGDLKKGLSGVGDAAKKSSGEVSKSMENIGNSLGSVSPAAKRATDGIKGFNSILNVLKANPIIATIAALTGLVIALFQPFKKMDAAAEALSRTFGTLSGIFDAFLNKILSPLLEGFVKLTSAITDGIVFTLDLLGVTSKETADRLGDMTIALEDLEDAEKDSAIATAESNRKLQEAREIAADANVPIRERIDALKDAGRIEKEELDKVVQINRAKASLMLEQIAVEVGARDGLIKKIQEGSVESLKAARAELLLLKNVDKDKIFEIDQMIIAADNAGAQSAKISKKVQSQITGIEREEEAKRKADRDAAAAKKKADQDKADQLEKERLKNLADANKVINDAYIATLSERDAEAYKLGQTQNERMKALSIAGVTDTAAIEEQYRIELEKINKKYDDQEAAKIDADKKKLETDQATQAAKDKEAIDKKRADDILGVENKLAAEALAFEDQRKLILEREAILLSDLTLTENQKIAIRKASSDALNEIGKKESDLRISQLNEIGRTTQQLGDILGQQTVAGKALGIATATINTYLGASEAIKEPSTLPQPFSTIQKIISVASIIATGIKTVKSIASVKVPGGGGGGSVPSLPSLNLTAPLQSQPATTTINQAQINQIGNVAARAYVVESDVTSAQERANRLNRAATIQ